jgi:pimeloyl-ACP methyl ester carboxylesterase
MKSKNNRNVILLISLILLVLSGCATVHQVNEKTLAAIYAEQRTQPKKYPVIFVPGIMGSILKDQTTNKMVWGRLSMGISRLLALPINAPFKAVNLVTGNDNLVPAGILDKYTLFPGLVEVEVYDKARRITVQAGGFTKDKDAFAFSYDWRKDPVEAAKQLGTLIDRIKKQSGNPNLKVNLVCHSQGGLIARYYVKYGTADVLNETTIPEPTYAGAKNINKIIMVGTPNVGSMEAFYRLDQGLWLPFIGKIKPETTFTMLSLYTLLPYQGDQIFIDSQGKPLAIDIYDPSNWEKYGWSIFNPELQKHIRQKFIRRHGKQQGELECAECLVNQQSFLANALMRANRFHQALWHGDINQEKQQVSYILFGSDCIPTLQQAMIKPTATGYQTLYRVSDRKMMELMYGLGDETVTKESLLGIRSSPSTRMPAAYEIFISESHGDLTNNPTFMDNVLHILLDQN